jgi:hypothetical protein
LTQHRREVYQRASNERGRHGPQDRAQEDRNTDRPIRQQTPPAAPQEGRKEERWTEAWQEGGAKESCHQKEGVRRDGNNEGSAQARRQSEKGGREEGPGSARGPDHAVDRSNRRGHVAR